MLRELAIAVVNATLYRIIDAGGPMTSSSAQDGRRPPAAFVGHELEFSELNMILADVAQSPPFR